MRRLYWLASYPKSGNTWLRIFLTNYWRNADTPVDINQLRSMPMAASRQLFELYTGLDSTELTHDALDRLRPTVYRQVAAAYEAPDDLPVHEAPDDLPVHEAPDDLPVHEAPVFIKVHDAYQTLSDGQFLFPTDVTAGVIYIVRNPLDVAPSFAAHMGCSIDRAIAAMNHQHFALWRTGGLAEQLRQRLFSWGEHVNSWTATAETIPCCVIRYEDMYAQPSKTFGRVLRFLHEPIAQERLCKAINQAGFAQLQEQEQLHGFKEKPGHAKQFFRKGQPGTWQQELTAPQIDTLVNHHHATMVRWHYTIP